MQQRTYIIIIISLHEGWKHAPILEHLIVRAEVLVRNSRLGHLL